MRPCRACAPSTAPVPGSRRRRRGRGFEYLDDEGRRVEDPEVLTRIDELAIPPAWQDVWICPYPHGHIQATGIDAAGRKQYRYHDRWRERRDQEKFDEMLEFAAGAAASCASASRRDLRAPRAWAASASSPAPSGCSTSASSASAREDYAEQNETYGLATIRKRARHRRGRAR